PTVVVIGAGFARRGPQGVAWKATLRNVGIAPALQVEGSVAARLGRRDRPDEFRADFYFPVIEVGDEREVVVDSETPGEQLEHAGLYRVEVEGSARDRTLANSWPIVELQT